jgi:hypothetical protein
MKIYRDGDGDIAYEHPSDPERVISFAEKQLQEDSLTLVYKSPYSWFSDWLTKDHTYLLTINPKKGWVDTFE